MSIYERGLDRNPANHQPLTPLSFLKRAARVWPERTAVIHGALRRSYADLYARSRVSPRRWRCSASAAATRWR